MEQNRNHLPEFNLTGATKKLWVATDKFEITLMVEYPLLEETTVTRFVVANHADVYRVAMATHQISNDPELIRTILCAIPVTIVLDLLIVLGVNSIDTLCAALVSASSDVLKFTPAISDVHYIEFIKHLESGDLRQCALVVGSTNAATSAHIITTGLASRYTHIRDFVHAYICGLSNREQAELLTTIGLHDICECHNIRTIIDTDPYESVSESRVTVNVAIKPTNT